MENSVITREAEMNHFQPHLGDTRPQELRSSPFYPTPLFRSSKILMIRFSSVSPVTIPALTTILDRQFKKTGPCVRYGP